jgi:hypothetical protein
MALTKRTRYEVLKRDNHTCRYCGATAPDAKLTVDHVTPIALGGGDDPSNLVAACQDCNYGKASTSPGDPLVADVARTALIWKGAQDEAARIRLTDRKKRNAYTARFEKAWRAQDFSNSVDTWTHPRPRGWEASIWEFYAAGLPVLEVEDAVVIACSNKRLTLDDVWRYFCGICWRKLDDINEAAKALLEVADGS